MKNAYLLLVAAALALSYALSAHAAGPSGLCEELHKDKILNRKMQAVCNAAAVRWIYDPTMEDFYKKPLRYYVANTGDNAIYMQLRQAEKNLIAAGFKVKVPSFEVDFVKAKKINQDFYYERESYNTLMGLVFRMGNEIETNE